LFAFSLNIPFTKAKPTLSILDFINDDNEKEYQHCTQVVYCLDYRITLSLILSNFFVNQVASPIIYTPILEDETNDDSSPLEVINTNIHTFHFTRKSIFLTYPQYYLNPKDFVAAIEKFENLSFEDFYTVKEEHKNRTPHYYVLGNFSKKLNIKNPRKFDIGEYYYNIRKTKNQLVT
jgi:hypothetical protein